MTDGFVPMTAQPWHFLEYNAWYKCVSWKRNDTRMRARTKRPMLSRGGSKVDRDKALTKHGLHVWRF